MPNELIQQLEQWYDEGLMEAADVEFVRWLNRQVGETNPSVLFAAAMLSRQTREGHVGLPLADGTRLLQQVLAERNETNRSDYADTLRELAGQWPESIPESPVIGDPENQQYMMIHDRGYLYLHRYWQFEQQLARILIRRASQSFRPFDEKAALQWINRLLPEKSELIPWQKVALRTALQSQLLVLSGGPGTGKTYTIVRLMALHQLLQDQQLHIALAAPTGKAAARINESIAESREQLTDIVPDEVLQKLPAEAQTIHRLLGTKRFSPDFRHNAEHPLPHDVIIVDEASMVDIALMTRLAEAVKEDAQLILIGDKDQLASVEAGSVLGDICSPPRLQSDQSADHVNQYSAAFATTLAQSELADVPSVDDENEAPALLDCMVQLTESRRFASSPEIGKLAQAINSGDAGQAEDLLQDGNSVGLRDARSLRELEPLIEQWPFPGTGKSADQSAHLFHQWQQFQVLCAHRRGRGGTGMVNRYMDNRMRSRLGYSERAEWYPGRPVMITQNNYELKLFNGDIGIAVEDNDGQLRICFEARGDAGQPHRFIAPAQLRNYESAWALTVHKSQGSEFDNVLLILPDQVSPILTRELVYTALTRAKEKFTIWGKPEILKHAIHQQIHRSSALNERLWT